MMNDGASERDFMKRRMSSIGIGVASGCASLVATLAVSGLLLGGLLLRWASDDSAVLTPQALGTIGSVLVATLAIATLSGVGLPRSPWTFLGCVGVGMVFGLFMASWMKPLVLETCVHGTGPQPTWCESDATMAEHVRYLQPHYLVAGSLLGLLAALAATVRTAIARSALGPDND